MTSTIRTSWLLWSVVSLALVSCSQSGGDGPAPPSGPAPTEPPPTSQPAVEPAAAPAPGPEAPPVPDGAKVSFASPADGATVTGPVVDGKVAVSVQMGVEGIEVKPAGEVAAGSGHHHILIDTDPVPANTVIPADDSHVHFGKGQTEATLQLAPGEHTLMLQFADGIHRSYGPTLSASIKITVAGGEAAAAEGETAPAEGEGATKP